MNKIKQLLWGLNLKLPRSVSLIPNGAFGDSFDPCEPGEPPFRPRLVWWAVPALYWLLFPTPTYAYIDPGTGSYIVQIVIAGLLGALVSLRIYWARVKAFFKGNPPFGRKGPGKHE